MNKKYTLTVAGKTVSFIRKAGENFNTALSRGAAKLGYKGDAFTQENFGGTDNRVTVTDRRKKNSTSRNCYTGICMEA